MASNALSPLERKIGIHFFEATEMRTPSIPLLQNTINIYPSWVFARFLVLVYFFEDMFSLQHYYSYVILLFSLYLKWKTCCSTSHFTTCLSIAQFSKERMLLRIAARINIDVWKCQDDFYPMQCVTLTIHMLLLWVHRISFGDSWQLTIRKSLRFFRCCDVHLCGVGRGRRLMFVES